MKRSPRQACPMAVVEICRTCRSLDGGIGSMTPLPPSESSGQVSEVAEAKDGMSSIVAIAIMTLIAVGVGAFTGLHLLVTAERVVDARKNVTPPPVASVYTGTARLRKLSPIVTNLAAPANNWARVKASIV